MPTFRYIPLASAGGFASAGTIDAPTRAAAVRELAERGITPSKLEVASDGLGAFGANGPLRSRSAMSNTELASFMVELSTAVGAGLPVVPALRTIQRTGRTPAQRELLSRVIEDVEHGSSLAEGLKHAGKPFGELVVSLVHAGEMAGRLPEVLGQAATLMDRDVKLRRALVGAMVYPAIILTLVVLAVIVVVTVIVPRVMASVEGQIASMPLPTRIVQGAATFFTHWWWAVILGGALVVLAASRAYADNDTGLKIDRFFLKVPVIGRLIRDVAVARFTRTLGTLTAAGLPVLTSLRITRATLGNRALQYEMDRIADQVGAGKTIADPLERCGLFPPLLVQLVNLGEKTGRLDELLLQASDAFEQRTEQAIKIFTTVLPPILICVLAGVVGFIILAILLPLLQLQESIGV
jgi:type II secretory pathway component PulF